MIIKIKVGFKPHYNLLFRIWAKLTVAVKKKSYTPIIIINFNRLECLKKQIQWLKNAGYEDIYILDNASTYPPLIDFYKHTRLIVFRLNKNIGHTAYWRTHIPLLFKNRRYVITDPDVIGTEDCPKGFIEYFNSLLDKYTQIDKVGFGLKIDDLPEHYPFKEKVINWESRFWADEIELDVYKAPIDTTFALYRANTKGDPAMMEALRTGGKYLCRHLPWYDNPVNSTDEDQYYLTQANSSSSWINESKGLINKYK